MKTPKTHEHDSCRRFRPHLHRFVEGELESILANVVKEHLAECSDCEEARNELELERLWVVESLITTPSLSDRLAKKIVRRIEKETVSHSRQRAPTPTRRGPVIALRASLLGGAAAAAVLFAVLSLPVSDAPTSKQPIGELSSNEETSAPEAGPAADTQGQIALKIPSIFRTSSTSENQSTQTAPPRSLYRLSLSRAIGSAMELTPVDTRPSGPALKDPCKDHNRDGEFDPTDVVHSFNLLIGNVGGLPPSSLSRAEDFFTAPECEEDCMRV